MQPQQIREITRQELPAILKHDTEMQLWLHGLKQHNFAGKQETNDRFESLLQELRLDREKRE